MIQCARIDHPILKGAAMKSTYSRLSKALGATLSLASLMLWADPAHALPVGDPSE